MELNEWDKRFIRMSNEVSNWSKDPNKQVGAVIVSPDYRQITIGYNGLPRNITAEAFEKFYIGPEQAKEVKNRITVHAEANAVLNAVHDVAGWIVYVTEMPCSGCSTILIQKQICKVICPRYSTDSSWYEDHLLAAQLFATAKIPIIYYKQRV